MTTNGNTHWLLAKSKDLGNALIGNYIFELQLGYLASSFIAINSSIYTPPVVNYLKTFVGGLSVGIFAHIFLKNISNDQKTFTLIAGTGLLLANMYIQHIKQCEDIKILDSSIDELTKSSDRMLLGAERLNTCLSPLPEAIESIYKVKNALDILEHQNSCNNTSECSDF